MKESLKKDEEMSEFQKTKLRCDVAMKTCEREDGSFDSEAADVLFKQIQRIPHGRPIKVQTNPNETLAAINRLPLFLRKSESLFVLFDTMYTTRLWCVWELKNKFNKIIRIKQ